MFSFAYASAAWAKFIVDGDLGYEIDARQIPPDWSTGYVPLGRSTPYQGPPQPFNSNGVQQVYQLNASLADFAFGLTANVVLPDDKNLRQIRSGYPSYRNGLRPPFVLEGDVLAADTFWTGDLLNSWAEDWVSYWTHKEGSFAMSAFEDAAIAQALQFLSQAGRADKNRLLARIMHEEWNATELWMERSTMATSGRICLDCMTDFEVVSPIGRGIVTRSDTPRPGARQAFF